MANKKARSAAKKRKPNSGSFNGRDPVAARAGRYIPSPLRHASMSHPLDVRLGGRVSLGGMESPYLGHHRAVMSMQQEAHQRLTHAQQKKLNLELAGLELKQKEESRKIADDHEATLEDLTKKQRDAARNAAKLRAEQIAESEKLREDMEQKQLASRKEAEKARREQADKMAAQSLDTAKKWADSEVTLAEQLAKQAATFASMPTGV